MADFAITRRGIVGAMMIAPVVIASPAAAVTQSDLSAKLAAHAAAVEATRQHDLQFREPASARFDAAMASRAHIEVQWGKEVWSTADHQLVAQARYMIDPTHKVKVHPAQSDYYRACQELVAAVDERAAFYERARIESGLIAALAREDELIDLEREAEDAVIECPVSTAADLARKLEFITAHDLWANEESRDAITADVARIAKA